MEDVYLKKKDTNKQVHLKINFHQIRNPRMSKIETLSYATTGMIKFKNNGDSTTTDITNQVHQLPCCIKLDGHSSVSHYFKPKSTGVESDGLSVEEAYFRGRKLLGSKIALPQGYSGLVLGKQSADDIKAAQSCEGNSNCWEAKAKFDNFTYWNHDDFPCKEDTLMRSFHWFEVSDALHKPVTSEDLASASIDMDRS